MAKAINLGRKLDLPNMIAAMGPDDAQYPDIYIADVDDPRLLDMPDKGEATIKYRIVSREHSERERGGKKERRCSIRMEVLKIDPYDNPKAAKKNGYGEDARKSFSDYFKDK